MSEAASSRMGDESNKSLTIIDDENENNLYSSPEADLSTSSLALLDDLKLGNSDTESGSGEVVIRLGEKEFDENEYHTDEESKNEEKIQRETIASENEVDNEDSEQQASSDSLEQNEQWRTKSKHIFVLSEAGKPIYSLHGSEDELVTFMGLLQALVSIIECDTSSDGTANNLRHVIAGDHKIVFMHRSHLILVNVSNQAEMSIEQLELELNYCYNQIISVVTLSLINKIFAKHHNYDLRNKLAGTEKLLANIVNRARNDFGMLLNCVSAYPMVHETREQISRLIAQQISPMRYVIFGLLLYEERLVSLIRPKAKNIHPVDVHLLVNVITGLDTPKSAEFTFYPICLPNFDPNGIMYAYISHLDTECKTCLILLTGLCDQDQSLELNECRKRIQNKLQTQGLMQAMTGKLRDTPATRLEQIGIGELKHFLFKDNKMFQYYASDYALPYAASPEQQQRIFNLYQALYHKQHNASRSLRIIYMQRKYETVLGWVTTNFEIYACFSPLVTKEVAIRAINKLLDFTSKNKLKLFLNMMPTIQR